MSNISVLAAMYKRVVEQELGLIASIDEDGDVAFRHPDLGTLFVSLSEDDPEFMHIVYPGFTTSDRLALSSAALLDLINTVNHRCKAAKLTVSSLHESTASPRVSASIESIVAGKDSAPDESLLRAILARCIGSIRHSATLLLKDAESIANQDAPTTSISN